MKVNQTNARMTLKNVHIGSPVLSYSLPVEVLLK